MGTWINSMIIIVFLSVSIIENKRIEIASTSHELVNAKISNHGSRSYLTDTSEDPEGYRLPKGLIPETYNIKVVPFFEDGNFSFYGEVEIKFNVRQATEVLALHARDLQISEQKVVEDGKVRREIPIKDSSNVQERDFHLITVTEPLRVGRSYRVLMNFEGKLRDDLSGFYKSSYRDAGGKIQWMALTHFEPANARKAFPCLDEPSLKAKFTISVARDKEMISLSNMPTTGPPEIDPNLPATYVWDHYAETPKMSTYLVAFIVSKFKVNAEIGNEIRVWARENAISQTSYSLRVARDVLEVMHDLMKIEYTLPKLDMVGIPDFQGGAMENWGLVTFRETSLLYQNESSNTYAQQQVASLVAHELAHQWFGNLVTPEWWKFTWMKEGFATYFQYAIVDLMEPSWRMMEQFVTQQLQVVFLIDALESPHPVSFDVGSVDSINSMFDEITYNKGGSLIRMMEHFLSRNTFFRGLQRYLLYRHHDTGNDLQLFLALDSQAKDDSSLPEGVSVKEVMATWTKQRGYPVITVERNYETNEISIKQERYVLKINSPGDDYLWWIPLTYATKYSPNFKDTKPKLWMPKNDLFNLKIPAKSDDWIIFNVQEVGFFRVNYDPINWKLISDYLRGSEYSNIHPLNRAQLIDDSFNLARGGYLHYDVALDLSFYMAHETDNIPWRSADMAFGFLDRRLAKSEGYPMLKEHILGLINPHIMKLRFQGSPYGHHSAQLLMRWSCKYGNEACVSEAAELFSRWKLSRENTIPASQKSTVYCSGISSGGVEEWEFLWKEYKSSTEPTEQELILDALGCSKDRAILSGYLQKTIDNDTSIRKHDLTRVFSSVGRNPEGVDLSADFIIQNFEIINARYTIKSIGQVISGVSNLIGSKEQAEKMKEFLKEKAKQLEAAKRTVEQAMLTLNSNLEWSETFLPVILSWLRRNYP